jgi:hypothetical protein
MIWALLILWLVLSMFFGFLAALGIMVIGFLVLVIVLAVLGTLIS